MRITSGTVLGIVVAFSACFAESAVAWDGDVAEELLLELDELIKRLCVPLIACPLPKRDSKWFIDRENKI